MVVILLEHSQFSPIQLEYWTRDLDKSTCLTNVILMVVILLEHSQFSPIQLEYWMRDLDKSTCLTNDTT